MRKLFHIIRIYLRNILGRKFEPETPFLDALLNPNDTCLHIGASDGRHSYYMSRILKNGVIYAFEPSSYTFDVFTTLNSMHGLKNVHAHNMALHSSDGELELVIPIKTSGRVGHSFSHISKDKDETSKAENVKIEKVKTRTMDGMVSDFKINKVDFIRCDTEGSEMAILLGGRETIARDLPSFLIEIHPVALRDDFKINPQDVLDFFFDLGYKMFVLKNGIISETRELVPNRPWYDYFYIHPSRSAELPNGVFKKLLDA
ncbi:MAG: FkbM family methyltransferase [Rhodospirillaceae bacterium]|nr:FkbM family methyltransferase [Rhodospirillaceae bacterium]